MALPHPHPHACIYAQRLRQPDVRRISKVGSQRRAPYPLELIHFTTLPLPLFLTANLCLHLHLMISLSVSFSVSVFFSILLSLISIFAPISLLSHPLARLLSSCCFPFQQERLICFVRQVKLFWKALRAPGGKNPEPIKVQCG